MTGVAAGLLLIAAVLFYKFVERRHKILLGKIFGVVFLLALLGIGYFIYEVKRRNAREKERFESVSIIFLRAAADTGRNPFRAHGDTVPSATFKLCNKGDVKVTHVVFYPQTFVLHRSTPYDLRIAVPDEMYADNRLETDYILDPRACLTLTWRGRFQIFDSVAARPFDVTVEASP